MKKAVCVSVSKWVGACIGGNLQMPLPLERQLVARARARRVLLVPGGPWNRTPRGGVPPDGREEAVCNRQFFVHVTVLRRRESNGRPDERRGWGRGTTPFLYAFIWRVFHHMLFAKDRSGGPVQNWTRTRLGDIRSITDKTSTGETFSLSCSLALLLGDKLETTL